MKIINILKEAQISALIFVVTVLVASFCICYERNKIDNLNKTIVSRGHTIEEQKKTIESFEKRQDSSKDSLETHALKQVKELELEVSKLKEVNNELTAENFELKSSKKHSSSSKSTYLSVKFWYDGNNYEISDTELKLYKDSVLSKEVSDSVTVVSPTISEDRLENGQTVYSVMSNKGLVFMSSYPSLSVIEGSHLSAPNSAFSQKETDKYLAIKFWEGPDYYQNLSEGKWYTDYSLQKTIDNSESIVIISKNTDCFVMKNGIEVYTAMAEDGAILWMHDSPSLETIE